MSNLWPIQVTEASGAIRIAGKAKGVPPLQDAAGMVQVPVTFNAPGLRNGIEIPKPLQAADVILGAWFDVLTPWNGTTPKGDFFTPDMITDTGQGLFANFSPGPQDMTESNYRTTGLTSYVTGNFFLAAVGTVSPVYVEAYPSRLSSRWKFVVSQDGKPGGADPGSTQGFALLNILLARAA